MRSLDLASVQSNAGLIWDIAELLRGDFKPAEYGKYILPFTVLRRIDCVLLPTKQAVLDAADMLDADIPEDERAGYLKDAAGVVFHNTSRFTFDTLHGDPMHLKDNLIDYVSGFSPNVRDLFLIRFKAVERIQELAAKNLLFKVFERFAAADLDLSPERVSNLEMGYIFEELIRKFSEASNETAGEHYTPREVIRLIVDLLFIDDDDALRRPGIIREVYDPACGTGGMLSVAEEHIKANNPRAVVRAFGQELNDETFAICQSDMMIKGQDPANIAPGNTLVEDRHVGKRFHYMLSNPPYGVDWKKIESDIRDERDRLGGKGRFGAGLPRTSDGQLLFLQHMISKMRDDADGSRIGIVMNGSPLFTGGAGSGESEIRRWIIENDWLEAIVALPNDLFYNTGIQTYVWILSNRKKPARNGKVQLIDASGERFWKPMKRSLGSKRREIPDAAIDLIVKIFGEMLNGGGPYADVSKIFDGTDFGYRTIRVERPLRMNFQASDERLERLSTAKPILKLDEASRAEVIDMLRGHLPTILFNDRNAFAKALTKAAKQAGVKLAVPLRKAILEALGERDETAEICRDDDGAPIPDPDLRDYENVPLKETWQAFFKREVVPFVPDAWVDEGYVDDKDGDVGKVGYEINVNRYFYVPVPMRDLDEIREEIRTLSREVNDLLGGLLGESIATVEAGA